MGNMVCGGAICKCSFGMVPSVLLVTPENKTITVQPIATIMDYIPLKNVQPFGMCQSLANPTVASATAAALGVLTPMPCQPMITAPWTPGSATVTIAGKPALTNQSMLMCAYGGVIQISNSGIQNITTT